MNDSKIHVYHVVKWFPNEIDDLEGIFVPRYIETLPKKYFNYIFYARRHNKQKELYRFVELDKACGKVFIIYFKNKITGLGLIDKVVKMLLYFVLMNQRIVDVSKKYSRADIMHVHVLLRTALLASRFSKRWNIPLVITEHWSVYQRANWSKRNFLWKQLVRSYLNRADKILAVSQGLKTAIERIGVSTDIEVIYNVVDTSKFTVQTKAVKPKKRFIHVSDFTEFTKNVKGIINATARLSEERSDFEMVLIGYGQYQDEIKLHAQSSRIQSGIIKFTGKLVGQALVHEFQCADAFILFSRYENLPCVLIEAMACGLPIVSSNVGGIPEIVHNFNGVLIESENEDALFEEMKSILDEKRPFDRQIIRDYAVQNFSKEVIGNKIDKIYTDLLQ